MIISAMYVLGCLLSPAPFSWGIGFLAFVLDNLLISNNNVNINMENKK